MEVYLIYDFWGLFGVNKKFFVCYVDVGGKVVFFIIFCDMICKICLNYYLYWKIVVIDGKIGWIGGFNVGD